MQNPSVRGLRAISNHCIIAHITVLLVALTATGTDNKDKIRFIKSFLPNIYFLKNEFSERLLFIQQIFLLLLNILSITISYLEAICKLFFSEQYPALFSITLSIAWSVAIIPWSHM